MKVYELYNEQFVPRPISEVFAFFERPENLAKITPASLGFVIKTPLPIEMKAGTLIEYTIRVLFLRVRWQTLISAYDPPNSFVDEQLQGPYKFWHHLHSFSSVEGGTMISDRVRYSLLFWFIGRIAHALFVRRELRKIFRHRELIIKKLFS